MSSHSEIKGTTRIVPIIGFPIHQVTSPGDFNGWFLKNQRDYVMIPFEVEADGIEQFVAMLRTWSNCDGCVVTSPFKKSIATLMDEITPQAQALSSVNVIRREQSGRLIGDNVDGVGFLLAAEAHGFNPAGRRALVVGAGGVGGAIAAALCAMDIASITINDLKSSSATDLQRSLNKQFPKIEVSTAKERNLGGFDLVVNASWSGMNSDEECAFEDETLETLASSCLVADVVTNPEITKLLAAAKKRGCTVQTGPEMAAAQMTALGQFIGVVP